VKEKLTKARKEGPDAVRDIQRELGDLQNVEAGVLVDLFLSFRTVKAWQDMITLVEKMPAPVAATVMVQEQLAFALNRAGQSDQAERVLRRIIDERGPSSETCGLLGRVYKDRWEAAVQRGDRLEATGFLKKAIDTYTQGFQADWRDAFPGINAVTLMTLRNPPDPRRDAILPVVSYAVEQRIASGKPDYWDYATRLELAVLAKDEEKSLLAVAEALACVREAFEPETTARNLRLIREAREQRGERLEWAKEVEQALVKKHDELQRH
jgi:tetratricopeptide (TPR) repeat protein